jgi:hypothetical protein
MFIKRAELRALGKLLQVWLKGLTFAELYRLLVEGISLNLNILAIGSFAALFGCGALYEDVPVYGQSDPASYQYEAQRTAASISVPDNGTLPGVDPGQAVDGVGAQDQYTDTDPSALSDFKQTLDPYGTWADDPNYGTVWQPDPNVVGADFAPYVTGGHWGYDDDYVWISDYDWGWAPFHYGRWAWIGGRGWSWVPGRTYSGAWVGWRAGPSGYGYVGWGPLAPSWGWRHGEAFRYGFNVSTPYSFCTTRDLFAPSLQGRLVSGPQLGVVANGTTPWGGRTLAHPGVGGPTPNHLGIGTPPSERGSPSWARVERAQGFAHPSTAPFYGGRPPMSAGGSRPQQTYPPHGTINGVDRPVATAPRYNGVTPRPYQMPYRSYGTAPSRSPSYSAPYRSYGSSPSYSHQTPYHMGGAYHVPSSSYGSGHSYSHSYSHGGGGGHGHR